MILAGIESIHRWTVLRRLTALGFIVLLVLGSFAWFPWMRGSSSATSVLGLVPFVDPLAAIETMIAARHVERDVLIGAGSVLVVAILLGPVFCGWLCPLGLLLDLNQSLRRLVLGRRSGLSDPPISSPIPHEIRYAALAFFVMLALASQLPVFQIVSPINIMVRGMVFAPDWGLGVVLLILVVEYRWPRLWCRALCPLGAVHSLAGRFGFLRIWINPIEHKACGLCTHTCPMGIDVTQDHVLATKKYVDDASCTRCGECADRCPRSVLTLGFRRPRPV